MPSFSSPLIKGRLIRRYKRFFADVELIDSHPGVPNSAIDAEPPVVVAHCANTGTMKTCGDPGSIVYLSWNPDPKRKLHFTWELTESPDGGLIGVNTARPNAIVAEAISSGQIPSLKGYSSLKREVPISRESRCDIVLDRDGSGKDICVIEVKNATMKLEHAIAFPDAVTSRGLKHLHELSRLASEGVRCVMFFLVNRPDGEIFRAAHEIDPKYAKALREAAACGVELMAWRTLNTLTHAGIGSELNVQLD
jgi:sugar fermentation stimulation protein A